MTTVMSLSMPVHAGETFLKAPTPPQDELCKRTEVDNGNGGVFLQVDSACVSRNDMAKRTYGAMVEAYNRSTRMLSADASTLVKPVEPKDEECQTIDNGNGGTYMDYACQSRNQVKRRDYNIQSSGWNKMQEELAKGNQQALSDKARIDEARGVADLQAASATEALRLAAEKNQESSKKSNKAANTTMMRSVGFGVAFAATCATIVGCSYPLLAASIAFGMMSAQNSRQANANDMSAYSACQAQSSLSGSSSNCVAPTPVSNSVENAAAAAVKNFDSNGKCISSQKSTCDAITAGLPPGVSTKDFVKGVSAFASAPPFKFNSDGTVTAKNGKTYKAADFSSVQAMKDAGFTAEQANQAMAVINKATATNPGLEQAKNDLKNAGSDASKFSSDFGGTAISGSGSSGSGSNGKDNGAGGSLGSHRIGGSGDGTDASGRAPAGEGLTRDFNGEAIGAAGDDIFSMMNRRYKMKTAQDSFISN